MTDFPDVSALALETYDEQVLRIGCTPDNEGRLQAVLCLEAFLVHPVLGQRRPIQVANAIVDALQGEHPELLRGLPAAARARVAEAFTKTCSALNSLGPIEDAGGAGVAESQLISDVYGSALASSLGSAPADGWEEELAQAISSTLALMRSCWAQLRGLAQLGVAGHPTEYDTIAARLGQVHLTTGMSEIRGARATSADRRSEALKQMFPSSSQGKYPVPPETPCALCDQPANGSLGDDTKRFYLCLMHLRQMQRKADRGH